jgi:transcriptional regulator with XRE-family HTH domain
MVEAFGPLLEELRGRAHISRNGLAKEASCDASYLTRIEHGDRNPPRQHIVETLARALRLSVVDRTRLLVAAGYLPPSVTQLGGWNDCLQAVADVLNDDRLSVEERAEFEQVVIAIARRWQGRRGTRGFAPAQIAGREESA